MRGSELDIQPPLVISKHTDFFATQPVTGQILVRLFKYLLFSGASVDAFMWYVSRTIRKTKVEKKKYYELGQSALNLPSIDIDVKIY